MEDLNTTEVSISEGFGGFVVCEVRHRFSTKTYNNNRKII